MYNKLKKELVLHLFNIGAIKFGAFRLKLHDKNQNAPLSPIYIDLRIIRSFPSIMDLVIKIYLELIRDLNYDLIADIPTAATPIAAILSHELKIGMVSPRMEKKQHGIKKKVEGVFKKDNVVLLVDDLVTHADSKLEAIRTLEEEGLIIRDVVVLVDREQGGPQHLEKVGYKCHTAFIISDLLEIYLMENKINQNEYDSVLEYLNVNTS